jgi:hypothetical protein
VLLLRMCWWLCADEADVQGKGDVEERVVGIREAYGQLWGVVRLPAVQKLALVLLAFRLGMLPAELAAPLKLLEKGVSKEALAGLVRSPVILSFEALSFSLLVKCVHADIVPALNH